MKGSEVPAPILMHWYMCGRKVPFDTEEQARTARPWRSHFYHCPNGDHWHTAHRPPNPGGGKSKKQNRLRNAAKAWDQQAYQPSLGWMDRR